MAIEPPPFGTITGYEEFTCETTAGIVQFGIVFADLIQTKE